MNTIVRFATENDIPYVHALIKELAEYEKAPQEVTNTVNDMLKDGFGSNPIYKCLVAETDEVVSGMAIYFVKYSTWKGKGVYLDDIVVTETMRRLGIGKLLFDAVMKDVREMGAKQLHWQVLDWNEPALKFYKKYNADLDSEWVNCKLNEQQLA